MYGAFTNRPNFAPFTAKPNQVPLTEGVATAPACGNDTLGTTGTVAKKGNAQAHQWTRPYPGDTKIYTPTQVPGGYLPSGDHDN